MLKFRLAMLVAIGLVCAQVAVADFVTNGSFESPAISWGTGNWITDDPAYAEPTTLADLGGVPGWTFTGATGLLSSSGTAGGGMWVVTSNDPYVEARYGLDGYQCVSWQSYDTGTVSQVLNIGADIEAAAVSFWGSGYNASSLMQVTLDGNPLSFGGSTAAIALNNTPSTFTEYTSAAFALSAGMHTLAFTAPTGVANLDRVTMVPEPTAIMLVGTGLLGLLAYAWRKRK